jgi:hypothetical protein
VPKANKVDKLRDHGDMDLGYLGFVNEFGMKREWMPQPRETWVSLLGKMNSIKGDGEKAKYMPKTKDFYNYQRNKE